MNSQRLQNASERGTAEFGLGQLSWPTILKRAAVVGLVISLAAHVIGLGASGLIRFGVSSGGGADGFAGNNTVDVAVITTAELAAMGEGATLSVLAPGVDESQATQGAMTELPAITASSGGQGTPSMGDLGAVGSGLGGAGSGESIGTGDGAGGAGGGGTKFFGVEARGSRFAFVVDVSGSMGEANKLELLRSQLVRSISGLLDNSAFAVITFSSDAMPLLRRERWTDASEKAKKDATGAIMRLAADGGTNPGPAFTMALNLRPRPDAIYFMTDGLFDEGVVDVVAQINKGSTRIPIHCITLMDKSSEDFMKLMAKQSGGTYTHIDVSGGGGGTK